MNNGSRNANIAVSLFFLIALIVLTATVGIKSSLPF